MLGRAAWGRGALRHIAVVRRPVVKRPLAAFSLTRSLFRPTGQPGRLRRPEADQTSLFGQRSSDQEAQRIQRDQHTDDRTS